MMVSDRRRQVYWRHMAKDVQSVKTVESDESLLRLHEQCRELLAGLDTSGLHQAAAHVSMAIDVMRRTFPQLDQDD